MNESSESTLVIGLVAFAALLMLVIIGLLVLPMIIVLLPLPTGTEVDLDPLETGVASIALPPSHGDVIVNFDGDRAKLSPQTEDAHRVVLKDERMIVTFTTCGFPKGCTIVLDLLDADPVLVDQTITLSYPEHDSEYLDEIELEYASDP